MTVVIFRTSPMVLDGHAHLFHRSNVLAPEPRATGWSWSGAEVDSESFVQNPCILPMLVGKRPKARRGIHESTGASGEGTKSWNRLGASADTKEYSIAFSEGIYVDLQGKEKEPTMSRKLKVHAACCIPEVSQDE